MNPEQWLSLKWNGGSTMSDRWLNQSKIIQYIHTKDLLMKKMSSPNTTSLYCFYQTYTTSLILPLLHPLQDKHND